MKHKPEHERSTQAHLSLLATESAGDGGVRRLRYRTAAGYTVGTGRLMGTTIGEIEVRRTQRRKGYGQAILRDLIARGGRSLIALSEESRRLVEREGFILDPASCWHVLPDTPDVLREI